MFVVVAVNTIECLVATRKAADSVGAQLCAECHTAADRVSIAGGKNGSRAVIAMVSAVISYELSVHPAVVINMRSDDTIIIQRYGNTSTIILQTIGVVRRQHIRPVICTANEVVRTRVVVERL